MLELETLYANLEKFSDFDENGNCENFLDTVDEIVARNDPNSIPILLQYFDDDSDYGWVLESLSSAIEHYNTYEYVVALLEYSDILVPKATEWFEGLLFHILNSKPHFQVLLRTINLIPNNSFLIILDEMYQESPHHRELIAELRKKLQES